MDSWNAVYGFEDLSLCNWKGRMCATIYTGGCNLRCPTCHNWELATNPQRTVPDIRKIVISKLRARKEFLNGLTITGGEPTIIPGLADLIEEIRSEDYEVNLHTNGLKPAVVHDLLDADAVKLFSVDVKGPWEMYPALTGNKVSADEAEQAFAEIFDMARSNPGRFYFRTTVVPGLSDSDLDTVRSYLPIGEELGLQEYRNPKKYQ